MKKGTDSKVSTLTQGRLLCWQETEKGFRHLPKTLVCFAIDATFFQPRLIFLT